MAKRGSKEQGSVLTIVLVGIIILLSTAIITAVIIAFMDDEEYIDPSPAVVPQQPKDTSAGDALLRRNEQRKSEAALLANAVYKYYNKNQAKYPTSFAAGQLMGADGTPEPVKLTLYKQVSFASGEQQPIEGDALRVVAKAICGPTAAGTVSNTTRSYAYAVQYSSENADGTFQAKCHAP